MVIDFTFWASQLRTLT